MELLLDERTKHMWCSSQNKMSSYKGKDIEALSEQLEFLQITDKEEV